jgi:glycosyltransferase involved in cell wall biosynthesis
MRVSKGLLMPAMPLLAWRLADRADVVNLHMPQFDASYIAWLAKMMGKPVVLTYQCDLQLPSGLIHDIANQVSQLANHVAAVGSDAIVSMTQDYAEHSYFLGRYPSKVRIINPPVELSPVNKQDVLAFQKRFNIQKGQRIIGMAARLATEKGVEYLVQALPVVLKQIPDARVLFVGPYQNVVGEGKYAARIMPLIEEFKDHWLFSGILSSVEMSAFFQVCDVLILPSVNSTEAFGMVQIEAMISGTPVVSSDLPGVRQPVLTTAMGKVVPPGDAKALAQAILDIMANPKRYLGDPVAVARQYAPQSIAIQYEQLFLELLENKNR